MELKSKYNHVIFKVPYFQNISYVQFSMSKGQPVGVQEIEKETCGLSASVVLTVNMRSPVLAVNASKETIPEKIRLLQYLK